MAFEIARLEAQDIDAAVTTIQQSFKNDPFHDFVFDLPNFDEHRNRQSLGIRLYWGLENGHIFVAHLPHRRCAAVAMWVGPRAKAHAQTWKEWTQEWWLWVQQVKMNAQYGRGGLNVKVTRNLAHS